jgi:AraC-like DNA-binding protein
MDDKKERRDAKEAAQEADSATALSWHTGTPGSFDPASQCGVPHQHVLRASPCHRWSPSGVSIACARLGPGAGSVYGCWLVRGSCRSPPSGGSGHGWRGGSSDGHQADGGRDTCRLVVVASGTEHAVRSDARSAALSIYLGPATREGIALNALSHARGQHKGVWVVGGGEQLADSTAAPMAAGGPRAVADFLVRGLSGKSSQGSDGAPLVHPQLRQALELVSSSAMGDTQLASVAGAVALSPDYLGRLCKQQTGLSFSATTRWVRLLAGLRYLAEGGSVTDAAHLAGFVDGSHANRACWELAGWPPSAFARALNDSWMVSPPAV